MSNRQTTVLLPSNAEALPANSPHLPPVATHALAATPLGVAAMQFRACYRLPNTTASPRTSDQAQTLELPNDCIVVLSDDEGRLLMSRADRLSSTLARFYPGQAEDDSPIDLRSLSSGQRDASADNPWHWSKLTALTLPTPAITPDEQLAALLAFEQHYLLPRGLYRWQQLELSESDRVAADDAQLAAYARQEKPVLLFIHGLGLGTQSTFGDLHNRDLPGNWGELNAHFAGRIYAYEHATFTASPLANALALAESLPMGLHCCLVAHSQGGLIADLLCIATELSDEHLALFPATERQALQRLAAVLKQRQLHIERYVRVATPAAGTALLAGGLNVFFSSLLSLLNQVAPYVLATTRPQYESHIRALSEAALAITAQDLQVDDVPGLRAIMPGSALTRFLGQIKRRAKVRMAVISGDTDVADSNLARRLAILFSDWVLFNGEDNDFAVETRSMRAGLARQNPSREFLARGADVSHFSYYQLAETRLAIWQWLSSADPLALTDFSPIPTDNDLLSAETRALDIASTRSLRRPALTALDKPVVIVLPDVMGTHLAREQRIWFDPERLALGDFVRLAMGADITTAGLVQYSYGEFLNSLDKDFSVLTFSYDWRLGFTEHAKRLQSLLKDTLDNLPPQCPVSLLTHGAGGLIMRALLLEEAGQHLWQQVAARPHSYWVMLGTPNHGSQTVVNQLLGVDQRIRELALLDQQHDLQAILDVLGTFPGLLQLMPPAAFQSEQVQDQLEQAPERSFMDAFHLTSWKSMRIRNPLNPTDSEQRIGAHPKGADLKQADAFWEALLAQETTGLAHVERIRYVFGQAEHTPSALLRNESQLLFYATPAGDGQVTWASGRLAGLPDTNYAYLTAPHAELLRRPDHFAAIAELLYQGTTPKLAQTPASWRQNSNVGLYRYNSPEPLLAGAEDLSISFFGGVHKPVAAAEPDYSLDVSVRAMDLRFARNPILCGHYQNDAIAGAERQIDQHIVQGALSQQERLGIYAGDIGTSTLVLMPRTPTDWLQGSGKGAIIVGLGEWDSITAQAITTTVRDAVLKYLLREQIDALLEPEQAQDKLRLNSLLIGCNSTTHISVQASIDAIVLGIAEANQQYRYNRVNDQALRQIAELEFIEIYLDTAITAAYAIRQLPQRLEKELKRLHLRVDPARELLFQQGMRQRLSERSLGSGYWPRLMITRPNMEANDNRGQEQLRYVFLSERARAEATLQQRQPGLLESLISESMRNSYYKADISRSLFQLLVPLALKSAVRQTERLLLVLDEHTATLPWEMLQADDEPLVLTMAVVRQLVATRYRRKTAFSPQKTAFVLGNPSTLGFFTQFPNIAPSQVDSNQGLMDLPGAADEAKQVANTLSNAGYQVTRLIQTSQSPTVKATDVFNALFKQPYRILMLAAHGEFRIEGRDGLARSGIILSDGMMLTAAEINQMEEVPDLVFLNCCHLGRTGDLVPIDKPYNRLAYSLARELIEMGVRCVVAAGWAVDDQAAATFSTTFFTALVTNGANFGQALLEARQTTWELYPDINTWGAYQAYGDPNYRLRAGVENAVPDTPYEDWVPVAPQELRTRLEAMIVDIQYQSSSYAYESLQQKVTALLQRVPHSWSQTPGIQYLLARLYAEILPDGFEQARAACQMAIVEEDRNNTVPIRALELLGRLEAQQAALYAEKASQAETKKTQQHLCQQAHDLIALALKRLQGLMDITQQIQGIALDEAGEPMVNTERFALLGDAYVYQAVVVLYCRADWPRIADLLHQAHEAYAHAEQYLTPANTPQALIQRLLLDYILDQPQENALIQARQALNSAQQHFQTASSFQNALMVVQAALLIYLYGGKLQNSLRTEPSHSAAALAQIYRETLRDMRFTTRKIDQAVRQLETLERLLKLRDLASDTPAHESLQPTLTALQQVMSALQTA